ncbi:MAG TPA: AAA family ATPase [Thermoplasmata archaeon]|nr:AAA family ATPase [Thermoplasmata archaeon]
MADDLTGALLPNGRTPGTDRGLAGRIDPRRWCLVLRGPLGIGKSTVAAALGRRRQARVISIDQILEDEGLEEWGVDRVALRSFLRANQTAASAARAASAAGVPCVLEGNFYWREQLEDLLPRLPPPAVVVRLIGSVELCLQRDSGRPDPRRDEGARAGNHLGEEAVRAVFGFVRPFNGEVTISAEGSVADVIDRLDRSLGFW